MSDDDKKQEDRRSSDHVAVQDSLFPSTNFSISSGPILVNPGYLHRDVQHCSAPFVFNLSGDEYLPALQIAAIFALPYDALRKRLERLRNSHCEGVIRVEDPQKNQPKYLYQLRIVLPEIEAMQCGKNVHRDNIFRQLQREKAKKNPRTME